jgi:hypothetical protein
MRLVPGHLIHWIHFNHSMREPSAVKPVTAAVDDNGLVHILGARTKATAPSSSAGPSSSSHGRAVGRLNLAQLHRGIRRQQNHMVVPQVIDSDSIHTAFSQKARLPKLSQPIISRQGAEDRKSHG